MSLLLKSKFFYYQLMHKRTDFKELLKFTLQMFPQPSSGSVLCEHANDTVLKLLYVKKDVILINCFNTVTLASSLYAP